MKKYKLLKDMPYYNIILKMGEILTQEMTEYKLIHIIDKYHTEKYCFSINIVENNPEFFEEVTRWKPVTDDIFYRIDEYGDVIASTWGEYVVEEKYYEFGNCFKTREQAEHARDEIKKLLLKLHEDEN